ncbi:MAG TPA: hypothetical protein VE959_33215 [Bryobacteraceae bacterium]|nr:hypothetical protein [Bryobacteraceae bacterium]
MLRKFSLTVLAVSLCAVFAQTAPSVDDLVARHLTAIGGADKLKAIRTMKITGKGMAQGQEVPITLYIKRPGLVRSESNVQGESIVQAFDGKQSWSINPLMGSGDPAYASEADSNNARERAASQLDGPLVDYKAKGSTVELQGKEDVEGSPAYKLKITTREGTSIYTFLDAQTYLETKVITKVVRGGQEFDVTALQGNFKPEAGVLMPHSIDQRIGTLPVLNMVIEKVEVNIPIEDSLFQFPAKPDAKKQ